MFLVSGMKATLYQYNRNNVSNPYDDQDIKTVQIKVCPYNVDQGISFGIYTVPEAKGYYQVPRWVDVREGDQIMFLGKYSDGIKHTILKVQDEWIFNRVENYILAVK